MRINRLCCLVVLLLIAGSIRGASVIPNTEDSIRYYTARANDCESNMERDTLLRKALSFAGERNYDRAMLLRLSANNAFKLGYSVRAQQEQIEAYEIFIDLHEWDWASMCLYERTIDYLNMGELEDVDEQLEMLGSLLPHDSPIVRYNYYSIASLRAMEDDMAHAISLGHKAIEALEQIAHPELYQIVPVWNYYNMAYMIDAQYGASASDSIEQYLQRAEQAIDPNGDWVDIEEANISILDMRAWLRYYRHDFAGAERLMQEVLVKIDSVAMDSPNTVISERGEAYRFLAMLYAEQGRWQEALTYQQRLNENDLERYDIEKNTALQEIETRYEVEKQQLEMERLEAKNETFRWLLAVCILLIICAVLVISVVMLRKRHTEDQLYEAALEQENVRSMLSEMIDRIDLNPLHLIQEDLLTTFRQLPEDTPCRQEGIEAIEKADLVRIEQLYKQAPTLTAMDKRYLMCFAAGLSVEQVSALLRVAPASVYTVRYRIRKKFPSAESLPY